MLPCTLQVICGGLPPKAWYLAAPGTTPSGFSVTCVHGNCPDTGRSTSGLGVFVGGSLIVHKSKLQQITTLSSAEAEFVALVLAICKAK